MREILFRGFHPCDGPDTIVVDGETVKGKWMEGYYVQRSGKSWIYPAGDPIISKSLAKELRPLHSAKSTQKIMREVFPVIPSTVSQYTGLKDSAGKRVFEGDILKFRDEPNDYEWIGRIEFGNPNCGYTWGFQIVHLSGPEPNIDTLCWFDMEEGGAYSEVIGTVFDEEKSHEN